jgi:hypothetical protein
VHVLHTKYKLLLVVCACSASVSSGTVGFFFSRKTTVGGGETGLFSSSSFVLSLLWVVQVGLYV